MAAFRDRRNSFIGTSHGHSGSQGLVRALLTQSSVSRKRERDHRVTRYRTLARWPPKAIDDTLMSVHNIDSRGSI